MSLVDFHSQAERFARWRMEKKIMTVTTGDQPKRGRGRPRLSDEEKTARAEARAAKRTRPAPQAKGSVPGDNVRTILTDEARRQLRKYVSEIERWETEKDTALEAIKDIYASAKASGFDTKAIRKVVSEKRKGKDEGLETTLDVYRQALGLLSGTVFEDAARENLANGPSHGPGHEEPQTDTDAGGFYDGTVDDTDPQLGSRDEWERRRQAVVDEDRDDYGEDHLGERGR